MDPRFDVELVAVTKRYGDDRWPSIAISLRIPKAELQLPAGPQRVRQDLDAAHDRRARGHQRGRPADRRPQRHRPAAIGARHGDDVPELRPVSASQLPRQRRLRPEDARRGEGRAARRGARVARSGADGRLCRAAAGPALGRPAAAHRARARADHAAARAAARRAAVGARPVPARAHARGAEAAAARARGSRSSTSPMRRTRRWRWPT